MDISDKKRALADAKTMYEETLDAIENDRQCIALMVRENADGKSYRRRAVVAAGLGDSEIKIGFMLLVKELLL